MMEHQPGVTALTLTDLPNVGERRVNGRARGDLVTVVTVSSFVGRIRFFYTQPATRIKPA